MRDRESLDQAVAAGSEQLKQGRLDLAQAAFRSALELEPDNARVLALLGLTYFRGQQFAEAQPIYEQLVERAPTDASHRLNLGLVYLKVQEHDKAILSLEASRALDPSQGRAVNYLGLAYARAGRYAEAYRSFLLAGQNELATEIEANLTTAERDGIHSQLGRTPLGPLAAGNTVEIATPRTVTPRPGATTTTAPPPTVARTPTPTPEPRTKPPSAPPRTARTQSREELERATQEAFNAQLSHPEIVIERHAPDRPAVTMLPARSGASIVNAPGGVPGFTTSPPPPSGTAPDAGPVPGAPQPPRSDAVRMSESMQFVLPKEAAPLPVAGVSMISTAVAVAAPSSAASTSQRTASGGLAPRPLSELATDELLRPDDGHDPFEISASGALIIRVTDRVLTRLDGVHVTGGDLAYDLAMRRSRGHQTEERFDYGGTPLHAVSGHGYLIAAPGKRTFSAVTLDDDILYLREDLVFAFESSLRWESGNVPGLRDKLPVVQFRGDGALCVRLARPLLRVKLPPSGVLFIDADRLAGWIGRVIPRAVVPPSGGPLGTRCVECTGEGIVLVEPKADPEPGAPAVASEPAPEIVARTRSTNPPPPPPRAVPEPAGSDEPTAPTAAAADETDPDAAIDALGGRDEI